MTTSKPFPSAKFLAVDLLMSDSEKDLLLKLSATWEDKRIADELSKHGGNK
jgi:hypothetical protein